MTTSMKDQTIGYEHEMVFSRKHAAELAADFFGTTACHEGGTYDTYACLDQQGRKWKFQRDSSIEAPTDIQRCELVSPILRWADIETLQELLRRLRAAGAKAHSSCGIHVHIGLGDHTPATLRNLVNLVNAHEDLLTYSLEISPERRSRWCQEVDQDFLARLNRKKPKTSEELARIWYDDTDWAYHAHTHYDSSRYHLLNLHAVWQKGTIEFRAFNSTMHAGEVKAYIQLCAAMSFQALSVRTASPARPVTDNPAYTFRCWLLRLGLIGEEFKTARAHLLKHLPGNAAWRYVEATERHTA